MPSFTCSLRSMLLHIPYHYLDHRTHLHSHMPLNWIRERANERMSQLSGHHRIMGSRTRGPRDDGFRRGFLGIISTHMHRSRQLSWRVLWFVRAGDDLSWWSLVGEEGRRRWVFWFYSGQTGSQLIRPACMWWVWAWAQPRLLVLRR